MTRGDWVIGLDVGQTSIRSILGTAEGKVEKVWQTPTEGLGLRAVRKALDRMACEVSLGSLDVASVFVGLTGYGVADTEQGVEEEIRREIFAKNVVVQSDIVVALEGASVGEGGAVLMAGTGVATAARTVGGYVLGEGWGRVIADVGGGLWTGQRALRHAAYQEDLGERPDLVSRCVLEHFGVGTMREVARLTSLGRDSAQVAWLASKVSELALVGDRAAREILDEAAGGLLASAERLMARLSPAGATRCLYLAGGMLPPEGYLYRVLAARLAERLDGWSVSPAKLPGVFGAYICALRSIGVELDKYGREALVAQARQA